MEQLNNTEFRALLKSLRAVLEIELGNVQQRHSGHIKSLALSRCSFDPAAGTFTFKLEGMLAGAKGKEAIRYEQLLEWDSKYGVRKELKGLPPLRAVFKHSSGKVYRVVGANRTGSKIIVEDMQGKQFLFKPEGVAIMYACTMANAEVPAPGRSQIGVAL